MFFMGNFFGATTNLLTIYVPNVPGLSMIKDFLDLLFPRCCILTNMPLAKGENLVSTHCMRQLPKYDLSELNESLHKRFYGLVTIKHAFAYYKFSKNSKVQKLLHFLKYKNCPELGEIAAKWFALDLSAEGFGEDFDIIIPVPLHRMKQRKRGYNQCDDIAKGLSTVFQIPWSDQVLEKKQNTQTQTKKSRLERYENASSVYGIRHMELIKGKRILLIDDVITTGATIGACAHLLLKSGCLEVSIAALASPE